MAIGKLYQITAPHFTAGIVVVCTKIFKTAPILRWSTGKTLLEFEQYCQRKGWTICAAPDAAGE